MDAEVVARVSSLVGCIYLVPSSSRICDETPPSSSTSHKNEDGIAEPMLRHADPLGFACLMNNRGESMVASAPIFPLMQSFKDIQPNFVIDYPMYNGKSRLIFRAELAYYSSECEVCIMKPVNLPLLSTRCLDVSFNESVREKLEQHDPLYCFFPSETKRCMSVTKGSVSLQNPFSYGLIAHFALALRSYAGIVTNIAGQIIGIHVHDFTINESDYINIRKLETRRADVATQVVIKDNTNEFASATPKFRSSKEMPLVIFKQVYNGFNRMDKHWKQPSEQSRIYLLSQARERLLFFRRQSSFMCCLKSLMVSCEDDVHDMPWTTTSKHKRQRIWGVRYFEYDDDSDDTNS